MNKKMKSWKLLTIILIGLISITIATGTAQGHLVQGQVNQNGTLWFISYSTPSGTQYPSPFDSFHANNLTLTVYSPLTTVQTAHIAISGTQGNTTRWLNQTLTIMPHQVQSFTLGIPAVQGQQLVSIEWENNTVSYYISTYQPVQFPFGNNPLGLLALVGIIMLLFTGINIGITKLLLDRAKYFPKLSQRAWLGILVLTGLVIYTITSQYYYDLTGNDWAIWLLPLWMFNLLMILSAWQGKDQTELYMHIKQSQGNDLETGIYSLKTAPLTAREQGKYEYQHHSGKEYIDPRSYVDFLKRLAGIHIPILMETPEQPDKMENPKGKEPRKPWVMRDRISKEHPYSEAYLLDPRKPEPTLKKLAEIAPPETEEGKKKRERKHLVLLTHLDGRHMKQAEYFLADYIKEAEAGIKIHELTKELANSKAEATSKAFNFQTELVELFQEIQHQKTTFKDYLPPPKGNNPEEKKEGQQ